MPVILALVVGALSIVGIAAPPAHAHSCATPTQTKVGAKGQVTIGVPAEQLAVTAVDVAIPAGYRLDDARPAPGWTVKRDAGKVAYSGGSIPPFECGYFTIVGAPQTKGILRFELVAYHADGEITEYKDPNPLSPYSPQLLLSGVGMDALLPDEDGDSDKAWMRPVGSMLLGAGVAGLVILFVRRRRTDPA